MNGFQYTNGNLDFFPTAEGYVKVLSSSVSSAYKYVFNYVDHLGNVRLSYSDNDLNGAINPATEIIEESNYYPFGLEHKGYNNVVNGTENNYQTYNGKELEEELGKNTLAFGWRDYDPAIARFNKVDRFAEKYYSLSTYSYAGNNPIFFGDVQGDSIASGSSTRKANRIERRAERRADRLDRRADRREARGKDVGDMRERASESRQSAQDIADMRSDPDTWYKFERVNSSNNELRDPNGKGLPVTYRTGENEITMFMPNFKNMHEPRHGGQIARGDYDIIGVGINGRPTSGYGAQEEISAYRAEYSSTSGMGAYGSLNYLPSFTPSQADALRLVTGQATMLDIYKNYQRTVRNINNIDANLLRNMYDTNGINQSPIYLNNPTIWWNN